MQIETNVRRWPSWDLQRCPRRGRYWGKSRSGSDVVKPTRLTRSRHHDARWEASVVVNHVHVPTSGSLTAQVRPKLTRPIAPAS